MENRCQDHTENSKEEDLKISHQMQGLSRAVLILSSSPPIFAGIRLWSLPSPNLSPFLKHPGITCVYLHNLLKTLHKFTQTHKSHKIPHCRFVLSHETYDNPITLPQMS